MESNMQPMRKGILSAQPRSPVVTPLTISDTLRVHSKSPVSSAAPIGRQSDRRENTPWNREADLSKPRSPSSPLVKPRVEANRIIKHSPGERCANCTDSLLQLKTKDKEIQILQDEISILQEKLAIGRDEVSRIQNELIILKDCLAMARSIAEESVTQK